MVNQLGFAKRFLLLVTPIATSSALAPLALSIAASPSLAATLASSEARFEIDKFSHNLLKSLYNYRHLPPIHHLVQLMVMVATTSGRRKVWLQLSVTTSS